MEINRISFKTAIRQTGPVYIHNIGKIVLFALLVYLPIALIQVFFLNSATLDDFYAALTAYQEGTADSAAISAYSGKMLAYFGGLGIINLFSMLYLAAVAKVTACHIFGTKITGTDLFDTVLKLFPKMLFTALLSFLFTLFGFILCFLPGILFAIVFSQATYLVVLTGVWKMQALKLSDKLVRRHTILFVLLLLLNLAFNWLFDYLFGWITESLLTVTGLTGAAADAVIIGIYIIQYIVSALFLIFRTVVLLQVIKHNSDLEIKLTDETVVVRDSV